MLYLFHGTDDVKIRARALAVFEAEGVGLSVIDEETYGPGILSDAVESRSLFGDRAGYLIDHPSQNESLSQEVTDCLPEMAASPDVFVIVEGKLLAAGKKVYANITHSEEFEKTALSSYPVFSAADALLMKDKRALWKIITEARLEGIATEEIIGILWWQLKTLRLAERYQTAEAAGLKSFPFSKAKKALIRFTPGEVEALSHSLLEAYQLGHTDRPVENALEAWVLKI